MAQVSFAEVQNFNDTLKTEVANGLPFGLTNFPSVIKLSTKNTEIELGRVISESSGNILAVFGIDSENNFTISFLSLDAEDKIITTVDGEEQWPPASVGNFPNGLDNYIP